ncbi:AMP-binding protein [Amycolatopsis acidicola]|uniref:AMP-binding protein n=1 Tax=Amycolatopsis acidicola TaxID=2596893 RepID=A0A5N0V5T0_9PSEU|nr:AMP-dependent synthetase/ligase [Amycolatopsis acidicola]KAA9160470.1 AMP-binding protein [Amycolatopsis acidicola]
MNDETADPARAQVRDLAGERSLCSVFQRTARRVADRVALRRHDTDDELTWADYDERVRAIAEGLHSLGLRAGDTLAIQLTSRPEFHLVDTAALHLGATTVSVYNTLPVEEIEYVLRDSAASIVVTETTFLENVDEARQRAGISTLVVVDPAAGTAALSLADVAAMTSPGFDFESAWRSVTPDTIATLVYTSGTTGKPKGVELSHRSLLGNQQALNSAIGIVDGATGISYLPMAHVAERHLSHYRAFVGGMSITCCSDIRAIPEVLRELHPGYFFSPPRLWEKFRAAILSRATPETEPSLQRMISLGAALEQARRGGGDLDPRQAQELEDLQARVGKPILAGLGLDRIEVALIGSAPVSPELGAFYLALGLPLIEAYGITECGAFASFGRPDDFRVGTVGKPVDGSEIELAEDGEILVRSAYLMSGYRNRPELTADAIDSEGWLHTGDIGSWDADGYLSIIDRKKELIINAAGKNMSPANIEAKLRESSPLIGPVVAVGDGRPYIVALIVPDPEALAQYAKANGFGELSTAQLAEHPDVRRHIADAVRAANSKLARVEQIKRFRLLPVEWSPGSDELSPTMKVRRKPIHTKYAAEIAELYEQERYAVDPARPGDRTEAAVH